MDVPPLHPALAFPVGPIWPMNALSRTAFRPRSSPQKKFVSHLLRSRFRFLTHFLPRHRAVRAAPSGGPGPRAPAGVRLPSYPCCSMEDVAMRNLDLAPLWRSTVGFDRFFDLVEDSLRWSGEENYPPYNIAKTGEDQYAITLALAGFAPEDVSITAEQNT